MDNPNKGHNNRSLIITRKYTADELEALKKKLKSAQNTGFMTAIVLFFGLVGISIYFDNPNFSLLVLLLFLGLLLVLLQACRLVMSYSNHLNDLVSEIEQAKQQNHV